MSTDSVSGKDVALRVEKFLKQPGENDEDFCKRCRLPQATLSKWRGGSGVSIKSLHRLRECTGKSLDFLAYGFVAGEVDPEALVDRIASEINRVLDEIRAVGLRQFSNPSVPVETGDPVPPAPRQDGRREHGTHG